MKRLAKILCWVWPILTASLLLTYLTHASLISGLLFALFLLPYLFVVLGAFVLGLFSLFRREWRLTGLMAALLGGTLIFALYGQITMDYLYFLSVRDGYLKQIAVKRAALHDPHAPIVEYFPWDGFLSTEYGIVYDETDQANSIRHAFMEDGKNDDDKSLDTECSIDVTPFGGHFYLRYFSC